MRQLKQEYERLEKQCVAAKAKLDRNDFDDLFAAERKYNRLHKKMWAARATYLAALNGGAS